MTLQQLTDARVMTVAAFPGTPIVAIPHDGTQLKIGPHDGHLALAAHRIPKKAYDEFAPCTMLGVDAQHLLAADIHQAALLRWDGERLTKVRTWSIRSKIAFAIQVRVGASVDGRVLAVVARDYVIRLDRDGKSAFAVGNGVDFWGVAVSPDGTRIATGRADGTLEIRDAHNLKVVGSFKPIETPFLALSFSPDGRTIALSSDSWSAHVLTLADGTLRNLPVDGKVIGLHWLPDDQLALVHLSRVIKVVRGASVTWQQSLDSLGDRYIQKSAVTGDGKGLVLACEEKGLHFLNLP